MKTIRKSFRILLAAACVAAAAISLKAQNNKSNQEADMIQTDFRLPFWHNTYEAVLTVCMPEGRAVPDEASVTILPVDGDEAVRSEEIKLKAGRHDYKVNIEGIDSGRYFADIAIGQDTLRRMLRVERVDENCIPEGPVTSRKLFFTPDDYLFEKCRNVNFEVTHPTVTTVHNAADDGDFGCTGVFMLKNEDGNWYLRLIESPYKKYQIVSDIRHEVFYKAESPDGPWSRTDSLPTEGFLPQDEVLEDYNINAGILEPRTYPVYDPAVHGTYTLADVRLMRHLFDGTDYGFGPAKDRTYYSMARTSTGDLVILNTDWFIQDNPFYGGDLFDNGFMTNDNFGSSWLSADGKTLYHTHGQTVRRFDPYFIHYDNLLECERHITLYSTTDGVSWKYEHVITVEQEPFEQQYWATISYIPDGNLYLVFVYNYNAVTGQKHVSLNYSHDGYAFHQFPGNQYFIKEQYPADFSGEVWIGPNFFFDGNWPDGKFVQSNLFRYGNNYYQGIEGSVLPHYSPDVYFRQDRIEEVTYDDIYAAFDGRGFEDMPLLDEMGGYEGIVDMIKSRAYSAGTISYRADGWFSAYSGRKAGSFTTREIAGGRAFAANATIAPKGYLKVKVIDDSGRVAAKVTLTEGDALDLPLFSLPEGSYRFKVRMKNCRLYTISAE